MNTFIQLWCGLKIKLSNVEDGESFWIGWGKKRNCDFGLILQEQTEDQGIVTYLPVHPQGNDLLQGQLTILSLLIFYPLQQWHRILQSYSRMYVLHLLRDLHTCNDRNGNNIEAWR